MIFLANILGVLAIICWVGSVQLKKKKDILLSQTVANGIYSIQYALIGAFSASVMNLSSFFRLLIFYLYEKVERKAPKWIMFLFMGLVIFLGFITFNGPLTLIPVFATILYIYSAWQDDLKILRYLYIVAAIFWIYYNFKVGAYIVIIGNVLEIISGITAIIRYKR